MSEDYREDLLNDLLEQNFHRKVAKEAIDELFDRLLPIKKKIGDQHGKLTIAPPLVDKAWRAALMYTQRYTTYCNEQIGFYVNYDPVAKNFESQLYRDTYAAHRIMFGQPNGNIWPFATVKESSLPAWIRMLPGADDAFSTKQKLDEPPRKKPRNGIYIWVKGLDGKTHMVTDLQSDDPVSTICAKLVPLINVPAEQQRLIFAGRQLDTDKTLSDYNITSDKTMHLVMRLIGC